MYTCERKRVGTIYCKYTIFKSNTREKLYSRMFRCGTSNRFKDLSFIPASAAVHH